MSSRVHILGICGTFMGGVALLARELGYQVSGSDANVYPPMSTMLRDAGIDIVDGYSSEHLTPAPDLVVIGNALSRGNAAVEYVLDEGIPYISGPQWLGELLTNRWVMAISGKQGKTKTSYMLTLILECAGKDPGVLVWGVPLVSKAQLVLDPDRLSLKQMNMIRPFSISAQSLFTTGLKRSSLIIWNLITPISLKIWRNPERNFTISFDVFPLRERLLPQKAKQSTTCLIEAYGPQWIEWVLVLIRLGC